MNDLTTNSSPFANLVPATPGGINAGAVAIEQERAIAEAQGQLTLAKRFPRSLPECMAEFLDTCKSPEFAAAAFYAVPNRGSGPSIRFAEEAARCYGNFVYGHRELSRTEGKSEIEVYAWDMQKNNRSSRQITVMHVTDTKNGPKILRDQADIDNKIANVASKQMRGRILALMPKHMIAAGIEACKRTIAGSNDEPISARVQRMVASFSSKFGVTAAMLADYIGHPLDSTTLDELTDLVGVFNALRDGAKPSEYFGKPEAPADIVGEAVNARIAAANQPRATRAPNVKATESKPMPTQEPKDAPPAVTTEQKDDGPLF